MLGNTAVDFRNLVSMQFIVSPNPIPILSQNICAAHGCQPTHRSQNLQLGNTSAAITYPPSKSRRSRNTVR
jgi:hypothetical protein